VPTELSRADVEVALGEHRDGITLPCGSSPARRGPSWWDGTVGRSSSRCTLRRWTAPPTRRSAASSPDRVGLRVADVELLQGERSRDKVVLLRGLTRDRVVAALMVT
jgi:hypothetical protein